MAYIICLHIYAEYKNLPFYLRKLDKIKLVQAEYDCSAIEIIGNTGNEFGSKFLKR